MNGRSWVELEARVAVVAGATTSKAVQQRSLAEKFTGGGHCGIPKSHRPCEPTQEMKNQKNGFQTTWQPATWIGIGDMKQFCNQLLSATILIHFSSSKQLEVSQVAECHSPTAFRSLRAHHHHPTLSVAPLQCSAELLQGPRLPSLPWMFELCEPLDIFRTDDEPTGCVRQV